MLKLFDILPDPALKFEKGPTGSILLSEINQSGRKIFGNEMLSFIGKDVELLHRYFPKITFKINQALGTKERIQDTIIWNSSKEDLHFSADFIKYNEKTVVMLTREITKQKNLQNELQESAEFNFGLMAEYSPLGMIYLDENGMIKYTNPASTRQMGFLEGQVTSLVGKSFFNLPNVKNHPELEVGIKKLLEGEPLVGLEIPNPMKGEKNSFSAFGTPRFAPDGSITGAVFMYLDKSKLEEMEEALREHEDLDYELVAEYSPLGIINLTSNGTITFANPTSTQLLGWLDDQISLVEGKNIFDYPFIGTHGRVSRGIQELLKGDPLVGIEFPIHQNNQEKVLRAYGSPKYAPDGTLSGAILMYADITDLKMTEKQLKHQKEELSEFAHQMAHDLKNDITSILGYTTVIKKLDDISFLDKIANHAKRMEAILNQSLELADLGIIVDKKDVVDLNIVADTVAELTIPQGIKYERTNLPSITCDREKVSQIFHNIYRNAVVHGEPNLIKIDMNELKGREFTGISLSILNDGKIIPQELRPKIFSRGFSTNDEGKGFGLYIVKKLVEAHGWTINLASSEKTMFQIFIPLE